MVTNEGKKSVGTSSYKSALSYIIGREKGILNGELQAKLHTG